MAVGKVGNSGVAAQVKSDLAERNRVKPRPKERRTGESPIVKNGNQYAPEGKPKPKIIA